ncbi:MAG: hypothetical protein ACOY3I_09510 [Verrucomicrobiota bacterium]
MRLFKFLLACALIPALGSTIHFGAQFVTDAMSLKTLPWAKMGWFGGGVAVWLVVYLTMSRPSRLYVFGHELTHAMAVWLSGGTISGFKVNKASGEVRANKMSAWIALAPYILPLYPIVIGVIWLILIWNWPQTKAYEPWFIFLWGASWSFHFCFTLSLLKTDQPDFASQGYFFSFTIISLSNCWILITLLWLGLGVYTFPQGMTMMGHILQQDYARLGAWMLQGVEYFFAILK